MGRISCGLKPYYHTGTVGVKIQFSAVQITKLVSGGGAENDNPFVDDIDGYSEGPQDPDFSGHSDSDNEDSDKESF